jgi:hypothetical protein
MMKLASLSYYYHYYCYYSCWLYFVQTTGDSKAKYYYVCVV